MKEIQFIRENKERWSQIHQSLQRIKSIPPSQMMELYSQTCSDLSYARTFYPDSKVVQYLNELSVQLHTSIYNNRHRSKPDWKRYFLYSIPQAVWQSRRSLIFSLIVFVGAIAIGIFSSSLDKDYARIILSDSYVDMTLNNIESGDPMAVYKQSGSSSMASYIAVNNIRVSFLAFVAGIFGAFGTMVILFSNGVMVGVFFNFFIQKGLGTLALSTIMIHGSLELSAIVIAGGAGMLLGNSLLFPMSYTRLASLRMASRRSIKIIIGLIPVFLVAALLEGFVTRWYLEMGLIMRLIIIVLSFAYIFWYFIYLPYSLFAYEDSKTN